MAKRIPPHKVEEIYAAADVVEVLGDYLQLKKRGTNYFALSPFANEKTPSFAISPSKNIWKDFSSGKGGNAVTFLMEAEGMTYVEALKYLAEKYHIELELEETADDIERDDTRESLYILNEFAEKYFHRQMMETQTGKDIAFSYFKERGISEKTCNDFMLGYSPDEWDAFSGAALSKQYKKEYLVQSGLCFESDKDGRLLDRFKGRIMFPIHNHLGKVVGFGGRILGNKENTAKYINSPESPIYHKSNILYGLHQGKKDIRDEDLCILVEGYMDVIALSQAGIRNVVASSGTALTVEQVKLISRFTKNVLLIYDADKAGINAAMRGIDILLEQELAVRVLLLPEGDDPDSYVKEKGKSGFLQYTHDHSQDFLDFKISRLETELDISDPQQKTAIIHEAANTLATIPDRVKQAVYVDQAASILKISPDVMERALNRALANKAKLEKRQATVVLKKVVESNEIQIDKEQAVHTFTTQQETEIIRLLLNYPDKEILYEEEKVTIMEYICSHLDEISFESKALEKLKGKVLEDFEQKQMININHFLNHADPEIAQIASELVTIPYEISVNWEKYDIKAPGIDEDLGEVIKSVFDHFLLNHYKRLKKEAQEKLKNSRNEEEIDNYLKVIKSLDESLKEICDDLGIVVPN